MVKLNFPEIDCNIRKNAGKIEIFDIIRKKYVALSPEEWVRQHVIHFLIEHLNYSKSLFKVESGLRYNRLEKRSDILIYNNTGDPLFLVECKSFKNKINQNALDQLTTYNKTLNAQFIMLTNGINHFCCQLTENSKYHYLEQIPEYQPDIQ